MKINQMAWRYRTRFMLSWAAFLAAIGFSLLFPHILGEAIDRIVQVKEGRVTTNAISHGTLLVMALVLLGTGVMRGVFDFLRTYTAESLAQKVAYDLRRSLYDKLQHLSFAFHDREHTGNLMAKATADVESLRRYINMGPIRYVEIIFRFIAIAVILFLLDWQLALLSLVFVPFLIVRSTLVMGRLRMMWTSLLDTTGQLGTILQENLAGIHVVKAFASEEFEREKYIRKSQELWDDSYKAEKLQGTHSAWITLYFTLTLGLILWFGGWQVIRGDLTPGGLTKFILFMNMLAFPVRMSAYIVNTFSRAISSGKRLFDVLEAESSVKEKPGAQELGRAQGYVLFKDASFAYDSRQPSLRNVNLQAVPGQLTAILGAPGSGKSTIVNLLPRFYDVTDGEITIDETDIKDVTLASLRRNVGIVQQDVFLFSGTIRDNIAYGAAKASFEDVVRAAKIAQLHDHIVDLPQGYNTWVGERGVTLSGGQKQRLSIARTILVDPPILVLDDSTSSVDVETERLIQRAMLEVITGRTTFVIAHRLSTVRNADLILVLADGEIVEQGTHRELMGRGGRYREIYDLQLQPQEELMLDVTLAGDGGGDN